MAGTDAKRIINGTFGSIYLDGKWLSNFTHCQIKDEYNWGEVKLPDDRRTKHKLLGVSGSGTIQGYKVTSELQKAVAENPTRTFEIISKLEDPEAYGKERIRIPQVKFTSNPLVDYTTGEIVEEQWDFVFDGDPEFIDSIEV
ncbi:phage tail tube protein [Thermoanaerobacterium sp. CMT5567-10]|uniref:phage tail tube protein n=1 Tax=Thermoanaerobacterium sp. CMT5567-10 TaxID=3061989 RepID=UPI0026DF05F2|nr:phage tail tube protein [Thermoanaerobacterium sp. CMT5567-10]WKV08200.1 phage tail tube protein [Thermoanaerobacterium sp. CMT5567-10]